MRVRPQGLFPEGYSIGRRVAGLRRRKRLDFGAEVEAVSMNEPPKVGALPPIKVREPVEPSSNGQAGPAVEVRGLSKSFGGIRAAQDLSLDLGRGEITALVGPNGAGKTTVFNLLTGAIPPDTGSVKFDGVELVGKTPDDVARLGMVRSFQDVRIYPRLSALQNVMMGIQDHPGEHLGPLFFTPGSANRAEREARDRAMRWLEFVGMANFADLPGGALSFGQTKLVALARVLSTEASVLLLDEPASGIDTTWVDVMLELISQLREQGHTICIVEHNLHVVERLADLTYFMELGQVTGKGKIEDLISDEHFAEAYFGTA
jgi:branched-chain amino acid transport system permease protein